MRATQLAVTTALATALAMGTAYAQTSTRSGQTTAGVARSNGSQTRATQSGSQNASGNSNMRIKNEVARYQGSELYVSPAGTRQIQQALNKKGYDVGNVSGKWNKATGRAAANFMQAQGLEPTTGLTVSLIRTLGLNKLLSGQGVGSARGNRSNQRLAQERGLKGTPLRISPAGVRVIKQAINQQGYDVGNINGTWDDQTTKAVKTYQQVHGLEPVGILDVSLIKALGVGNRVYASGQARNNGAQGGRQAAGAKGSKGSSQRIAQESTGTGNNGGSRGAAGHTSPGTPLYISSAGVRDVTQALNKVGYDAGPVNGQWSKGLSKAVANYEQAKGLEPSGTLTTAFLANIGLNQWLPLQGAGGRNGASAANGANQNMATANGVRGRGSSNQRISNETTTGSISGGANAGASGANGTAGTAAGNNQ
ncbi:peptidoglycan-binding protein [Jiella sp. M17.18]|uniref:peptidoglycan-binding domain-containing protein n=1 Tax=Jiella sp. M17.18 TaxID=3234247 RepID=UPI0034DFBD35